jgi:hypothetical protein
MNVATERTISLCGDPPRERTNACSHVFVLTADVAAPLRSCSGTDYYPSTHSDSETLIVTTLVVFGALLWTRVLALFCNVATNSNPGIVHFNQNLDALNEFIKNNELPKEMGRRLREYSHSRATQRSDAPGTLP